MRFFGGATILTILMLLTACAGTPAATEQAETAVATAEETEAPERSEAPEESEEPEADFTEEDIEAYCELQARIGLTSGLSAREIFIAPDPAAAQQAAGDLVAELDGILEAARAFDSDAFAPVVEAYEETFEPIRDAAAELASGEATVAEVEEVLFTLQMASSTIASALPTDFSRAVDPVCYAEQPTSSFAPPPPVDLPSVPTPTP